MTFWNVVLCDTCIVHAATHHCGNCFLVHPLVFHKKFAFHCKYGCTQLIFCAAHVRNYIFVYCLPMSRYSNCTYITDGKGDRLFSCCVYFIWQWAPFNSPSSIDIFAMMSYCLFTVTVTQVVNLLWFLHICDGIVVVCFMRHQMVVHLWLCIHLHFPAYISYNHLPFVLLSKIMVHLATVVGFFLKPVMSGMSCYHVLMFWVFTNT